ncbi:MAG TPA: VIT1/CCC1 transporter family protein [Bdellovibrionota bacterium]|nr:VIT1/CCC1 transporter family protein [Bdellovibrionota bacterium]
MTELSPSEALESWREEKRSAYLYRQLAETERGTNREKLFLELAIAAERQAEHWEKSFSKFFSPDQFPGYRPSLRIRFILLLARKFGPWRIKPILAGLKVRGLSVYSDRPALPAHQTPAMGQVEPPHRFKGSSGSVRAAVFGINDGLVSNASLILGVAAASRDPKFVLISGTAGLLAGALSMAAGEYVSVRSQRELLEYQLGLEKAELEQYPEEEAQELALIYEARGFSREQAEAMARQLISNPARALDTLAREELGLDPNDLGSPWGAAVSSFVAFAIGGLIPLIPFVISRDMDQLSALLRISMISTAVGLFSTGAFVSLFSGKGLLWSGFRMLLIGSTAGTIAYLIGSWMGAAPV